jgi:hypothetical protein
MTLTIEVPAEVESALEAKARRRGVPVDELLRGVVSDFAQAPDAPADAEERRRAAHRARVRALQGKYAHVPGTVDDFMRERSEEAKREMQKETA